jgi:hypothetical protein
LLRVCATPVDAEEEFELASDAEDDGPKSAVAYETLFESLSLELQPQSHLDPDLDGFYAVREKGIRESIAKRLRSVCSQLSDAEFEELVRTMAKLQLRSERRACS